MPNQMIALQARNPQLPDPARITAQYANMMNTAAQQRASQLQGERLRQEMDYARAGEERAAQTHTSAQKKAELEYVGLVADQFSRDVAKLKEGDIAGAEALRANIVREIPAWGNYIRPASEWTTEYRTQLMLKGKEIADKTIPDVVASKEYAAAGARDAQGNPIPEGTVIDTRTGGFTGAAGSTPLKARSDAPPAPRATPTASPAAEPANPFAPGYQPNSAAANPNSLGLVIDSALETGVMSKSDYDKLLSITPPESRAKIAAWVQQNNVQIMSDMSGVTDNQMRGEPAADFQTTPMAYDGQTPQSQFAVMRGEPMQSQTAGLRGAPPMEQTLAQYIPVMKRDPNVAPTPSPVPAGVIGAQEGARTSASKAVELEMAPKIAAATKNAERAIEKRSEALVAKNETKTLIQSIDKYIEEIDALLRSADRRFIVGRIEGNLHYLGSLGQNERQAELQAMFDRVKNADTLGSLVAMKQASPSGGSPVGNASNQDVQLVAKGANSLTQTGGVPKFDADLKKLRRDAYRTRQNAIEFYNDRYGDLSAEDPKFKLTVRPIADRYISSKDLPKKPVRTPTKSTLSPATRAKYGL